MSFTRLRNDSNHSISIPDLGVYLPGRGSEALVDTSTLSVSTDIGQWRHCVSTVPVEAVKPMPLWPFHEPKPVSTSQNSPAPAPAPDPGPAPVTEDSGTLTEIRDLLRVIASQQSLVSVSGPNPVSRPILPLAPDAPVFIPGTITPANSESKINVKGGLVEKSDFDDAKNALSRLRKR